MFFRIIIVTVFCFQFILNVTRPSVTLYASQFGASTFEIGLITSAYAFLPLLLAIRAGKITDRIGNRIPVAFGFVGVAVGMGIPYLFPSLWALYVSQIIVGVAHIFIVISLQNVIGNESPPEKRDYYFSMFSTAVSIAAVIGPVAGGYLVEHFDYPAVFLAGLLFCLPPLLMFYGIPHSGNPAKPPETSLAASLGLLKLSELRKALIASALALYSRDIFVAYFPLYADGIGLSATAIGWILSIQGFMMVAVRFFLTRLTDFFGRDRVLVGSICIAGIAFLLVPVTDNVIFLTVSAGFMGAGLGCGQPLSMTTTYNASPKSRTGEVLGLRLMVNRLSQLIAPLLFGVIGTSAGLLSVFLMSGAFLLGGTLAIKPSPETLKQQEESN